MMCNYVKINQEPKVYQYFAIFLAVLGILSPVLVYLISGENLKNPEKLAQIGDWIGGSSSPILGLAGFMMILAAYLSQREELRLNRETLVIQNEELSLSRIALDAQREELKLTRQEMEFTRQEFVEQTETMKKQRFESTFFHLLNFHNEIVQTLNYSIGATVFTGRDIFLHANYELIHYRDEALQKQNISRHAALDPEREIKIMLEAYNLFWASRQDQVGHYFKNFLGIIYFASSSSDNYEEQSQYMHFITSLLSPIELIAIYYYVHFGPGYFDFFKLVQKYDLFANIDKSQLRSEHRAIDHGLLDSWRIKNR